VLGITSSTIAWRTAPASRAASSLGGHATLLRFLHQSELGDVYAEPCPSAVKTVRSPPVSAASAMRSYVPKPAPSATWPLSGYAGDASTAASHFPSWSTAILRPLLRSAR
jgi:hypothetical protein